MRLPWRTGDADSRDQLAGGPPTVLRQNWRVRPPLVRPASPGKRAIAAPASRDERAPRLIRGSRSQRTTSRRAARDFSFLTEATLCGGVPDARVVIEPVEMLQRPPGFGE